MLNTLEKKNSPAKNANEMSEGESWRNNILSSDDIIEEETEGPFDTIPAPESFSVGETNSNQDIDSEANPSPEDWETGLSDDSAHSDQMETGEIDRYKEETDTFSENFDTNSIAGSDFLSDNDANVDFSADSFDSIDSTDTIEAEAEALGAPPSDLDEFEGEISGIGLTETPVSDDNFNDNFNDDFLDEDSFIDVDSNSEADNIALSNSPETVAGGSFEFPESEMEIPADQPEGEDFFSIDNENEDDSFVLNDDESMQPASDQKSGKTDDFFNEDEEEGPIALSDEELGSVLEDAGNETEPAADFDDTGITAEDLEDAGFDDSDFSMPQSENEEESETPAGINDDINNEISPEFPEFNNTFDDTFNTDFNSDLEAEFESAEAAPEPMPETMQADTTETQGEASDNFFNEDEEEGPITLSDEELGSVLEDAGTETEPGTDFDDTFDTDFDSDLEAEFESAEAAPEPMPETMQADTTETQGEANDDFCNEDEEEGPITLSDEELGSVLEDADTEPEPAAPAPVDEEFDREIAIIDDLDEFREEQAAASETPPADTLTGETQGDTSDDFFTEDEEEGPITLSDEELGSVLEGAAPETDEDLSETAIADEWIEHDIAADVDAQEEEWPQAGSASGIPGEAPDIIDDSELEEQLLPEEAAISSGQIPVLDDELESDVEILEDFEEESVTEPVAAETEFHPSDDDRDDIEDLEPAEHDEEFFVEEEPGADLTQPETEMEPAMETEPETIETETEMEIEETDESQSDIAITNDDIDYILGQPGEIEEAAAGLRNEENAKEESDEKDWDMEFLPDAAQSAPHEFAIEEDDDFVSQTSDQDKEDRSDHFIDNQEGRVHFSGEKDERFPNREELKQVISYLDNLLGELPDNLIEKFSRSEYFSLYQKVMDDLGL